MALSFNGMKVALDVAIEAAQVPNIVGLQGIGKSDLVREFCRERGYYFSEITCSLIQEGDLSMPYIHPDGSGVGYAINTIISKLSEAAGKCKYAVLFLDEFNRASPQAQSELMNLVLQRRVVDYTLPGNVRLVLAMNPNSEMDGYGSTNYAVSFSDSAIMGRVVCLDMVPTLTDWLDYADRVDGSGRRTIHSTVSSFLTVNRSLFCTKEVDGRINNTPRGWSRVSDLVYSYEAMGIMDKAILRNLLEGTLEKDTARVFLDYYLKHSSGVDLYKVAVGRLTGEVPLDVGNFSDIDLNEIFEHMSEYILKLSFKGNSLDVDMFTRYRDFIMSVSRELCYSFVVRLQDRYEDIYDTLMEDDSFSEYVVSVTCGTNVGKDGTFHGKL